MKKSFIIITLGSLLYGFSLFNGFVWDDEVSFGAARNSLMSSYFRPVMNAFYAGMNLLFGAEPFFFHLTSVLFHIATAVLLYFIFKRFFKESIAFFLSLLFLVHPSNVEAVCFASALQEILFTFTGILGVYTLVIPMKTCLAGRQVGIQSRITISFLFSLVSHRSSPTSADYPP